MNILKTSVGDFGPFFFADRQGDAWLCDGVLYPDTVVGNSELEQVMQVENPDPVLGPADAIAAPSE